MTSETGIRILPPVIPLAMLALGAAAHAIWPIPLGDSDLLPPIGMALIALSFVPVALAAIALRKAGTTSDARRGATRLVEAGIFGISRNPMYLSMMILFLGIALTANSLAMLVLMFPTGSLLCHVVIRKEEAYLRTRFGAEFDGYCSRVRRWA